MKSVVSGCLILISLNSVLWAQSGTAGAFLRVGVGARAKAMGGAYTALATGVEASYYNPAALPLLEKRELNLSIRRLSLDRSFTFVGLAVPIEPKVGDESNSTIKGGFSLAWLRAGVSNIDGRNSDGSPIGDISNSENAFIFSFALNPTEMLSVGLSVKVLYNRFTDIGGDNLSANGVGFDLGALLTPRDWLSIGVVLKDFNSKYRWSTGEIYGEDASQTTVNQLPRVLRIGAAVKVPRFEHVKLTADFEQFYNETHFSNRLGDRIHLGVEGLVLENVVVRGGYDDGSVTAGGGYLFGDKFQLNYAFRSPGNRPEGEHVFTWIFQF